jgi:cytochrome P450
MSDTEFAAEAADHMLAGSDTTAETPTFMVWQISRPGFQRIQDRLREELKTLPFDARGMPVLRPIDKLPCLNAVVNETLRVYPAIPMSEQRVAPPRGAEILGYYIPGGTVCSLQPYIENRNSRVVPDPEKFELERWMIDPESEKYKEMSRTMWTFGSGGRLCFGVQYPVWMCLLMKSCDGADAY